MKCEWQFHFETRDFRFEKETKFLATPNTPITFGDRPPELFEFPIRIVPRDTSERFPVTQTGFLYATLPGSYEDTRDLAYHMANMMAERLSFQFGDFQIRYGMVACERIAETTEEETAIGDAPYAIECHLEEVLPPTVYETSSLVEKFLPNLSLPLVAQFNETNRDDNPVRQFLGYFKIVESILHSSSTSAPLKKLLAGNAEIESIYNSLVTDGDFNDFATSAVNARHRCAHLKLTSGFGYTPIDPAIESEVKPLLPILAQIAYQSILRQAPPQGDA